MLGAIYNDYILGKVISLQKKKKKKRKAFCISLRISTNIRFFFLLPNIDVGISPKNLSPTNSSKPGHLNYYQISETGSSTSLTILA